MRQAAAKRLKGEGKQQRSGERPFPPRAQPAGAPVKRERRADGGEQQREVRRREYAHAPREPPERAHERQIRRGISAPVGPERRAQPRNHLRLQRQRIPLGGRLDAGENLQRVATVVGRHGPTRERPTVIVSRPHERRDQHEEGDAPLRGQPGKEGNGGQTHGNGSQRCRPGIAGDHGQIFTADGRVPLKSWGRETIGRDWICARSRK